MGGRGSSYIRQQTSEQGLQERAEKIHELLNEMGTPAKKSIEETKELLRKRDRENGLVYRKKPDPTKMDSTSVYRELDRTTKKLETTYTNEQIAKFKTSYNSARSEYSKGNVAKAESKLSNVPYDYIRYRALDESMYGDFQNEKHKNFIKKYY